MKKSPLPILRVNSKGKTICPPNIPHQRTNKSLWAITAASIASSISSILCYAEDYLLFFGITAICVQSIVISEILRRFCLLYSEYEYLNSRYNMDIYKLLKHVFYFKTRVCIIETISLLFLLITKFKNIRITSDIQVIGLFFNMIAVFILYHQMHVNHSPLYDSIRIKETKGLDYGSGMAHSFFHGYLKIVLPYQGVDHKGLKELMEDYEAKHNITFESYKLYILVPMSLYCPSSLENTYSESVKKAATLESTKKDRAGVKDRIYKNSVYKISVDGTLKYVCAEYATPLETLREVIGSGEGHAALYDLHKKEIIWHFYDTLRNLILETPTFVDLCELIYFDDKLDGGSYYDVGTVINQRVVADKKKQKKNGLLLHDKFH